MTVLSIAIFHAYLFALDGAILSLTDEQRSQLATRVHQHAKCLGFLTRIVPLETVMHF